MSTIRREKILLEPIESVVVGKAFHVYQRRNEWLNWDGDTSLVNRTWIRIIQDLRDAEQFAESSRSQGTKFVIDELPYIFVSSKSGGLAIAEFFSDAPLSISLNLPPHASKRSIQDLQNLVQGNQWTVAQVLEAPRRVVPHEAMYFTRTSSPGKSQNSLGWTLTARKMNFGPVTKLAEEIREKFIKKV